MNSTEINTSNRSTTANTPTNSATVSTSNRSTTVTNTQTTVTTTLAVIGFVALVTMGMWLAVYSTRYVPTVVNRAGEAAVYLGSLFKSASTSLSVVPTAPTTISFGDATSSTPTSSAVTTPTPTKPVSTTPGVKTTTTYPISGTALAPTLTGLPDLVVTINAVGYLTATSSDSMVATSTIPAGNRPAVSFTIKNVGTNATGSWRFSASIPTQTSYIYESQPQQSLNPGDSIDYTLGFDQANKGSDKMISITANFDHTVAETNATNNSASTKVTILGS